MASMSEEFDWVPLEPAETVDYGPVGGGVRDWTWDRDLRLVTSQEITEDVITSLEEGAPYAMRGTEDEQKNAMFLSVSFTETLVDKAKTPHLIHFTDMEFSVDPFSNRQAKPLIERVASENELLENDPLG